MIDNHEREKKLERILLYFEWEERPREEQYISTWEDWLKIYLLRQQKPTKRLQENSINNYSARMSNGNYSARMNRKDRLNEYDTKTLITAYHKRSCKLITKTTKRNFLKEYRRINKKHNVTLNGEIYPAELVLDIIKERGYKSIGKRDKNNGKTKLR